VARAGAPRLVFVSAAAAVAIVTAAVFRLPGTFVEVLERNALLQESAAGWAVRLLAIAAAAQAAYVGFVVLRPDRVARTIEHEGMSHDRAAVAIASTAAATAALTLLYGLAAFLTTGERGGFWIFSLIAVAQITWYLRLTGNAIDQLRRQPERPAESGYCPPLARGFVRGGA
jgi:hypothetical protein